VVIASSIVVVSKRYIQQIHDVKKEKRGPGVVTWTKIIDVVGDCLESFGSFADKFRKPHCIKKSSGA